MESDAGLMSGLQREKKRSLKDSMMGEEELEEPDLDFEECSTKSLYKEPKGSLIKKRQHSGRCGDEPALSSGFLPAYPICAPQAKWGIGGEEEDFQDKLLHLCCTAGGSIDQPNPGSILEYLVYLDHQHNMADCPITTAITPPATPGSHRLCPSIPVPSSAIASTESSAVSLKGLRPMTDSCSPISSLCSITSSARDSLISTSRGPGCSERDPVNAAAHLHLLGESLSLIGHHLQETNKMVSVSSSLSLLLDSLLCGLAPLICLTTEVPELRSCTQHTLASTLENIAYVMPGM